MPRHQAKQLLNIASELVPSGIYAIERNGYIELMNTELTHSEIKKKRKEYGRAGWKVYANE